MKKYTVFNNRVFDDLKELNDLALFIYLYSGKFVGVDKTKLWQSIGMTHTAFTNSWKRLNDLGYIIETNKGLTVSDEPDTMLNHTNS